MRLDQILDLICGILSALVVVLSILMIQIDGHVWLTGILIGLACFTFSIKDNCCLYTYILEVLENARKDAE